MSAQLLTSLAGIGLSLIFSYAPKVNDWYKAKEPTFKRLFMLGALVLVSAGSFGLACADWFNINLTCDQAGVEVLLSSFVLALVANQSAYAISPKPGQ